MLTRENPGVDPCGTKEKKNEDLGSSLSRKRPTTTTTNDRRAVGFHRYSRARASDDDRK